MLFARLDPKEVSKKVEVIEATNADNDTKIMKLK